MNTNYTTVRNGVVLLWRHGWNSPSASFGRDAASAVTYGNEIVVNWRDGKSTLYRITPNGTNAVPVRSL
jgi:hypothetical protein